MMRKPVAKLIVSICAFLMAAESLYAAGGLMVKNIELKNGTKTIFSDTCTTDKISPDWQTLVGVSPSLDGLILNSQGNKRAYANRFFDKQESGILEFSANIWVGFETKYYNYQVFSLNGHSNPLSHRIGIELLPNRNETGYGLELFWEQYTISSFDSASSTTVKPVIEPNVWVQVKLQVDINSHTATLFVDNEPVSNVTFDQDNPIGFESLNFYWDGTLEETPSNKQP